MPYFLVTFTVPEELREPIRSAMKVWYGALLKESAGALQDLAAQPKHLGAELGLTAVLQTWTRDLRYHPHVHVLAPGGGLSADGLHWRRVKDAAFFLPQQKLAARFKGRLKAWLQAEQPELFQAVPAKAWWRKWVVDIQAVGSGAAALKYLAAYVHRGPLHPARLKAWDACAEATSRSVTGTARARNGAARSAAWSSCGGCSNTCRPNIFNACATGAGARRRPGRSGNASWRCWIGGRRSLNPQLKTLNRFVPRLRPGDAPDRDAGPVTAGEG